mgnify:CR=1 FL=1
MVLYLSKLEFPSPKDALCQVWLKLAQWFWRRRFLHFVNLFSLFRNYLPLEKERTFIWTNLNPLLPRMHYAKFGWNWPSGSGEKDKNVKSLRQQRRRRQRRHTTDKFWSEKLTWTLGSGELNFMISNFSHFQTFSVFVLNNNYLLILMISLKKEAHGPHRWPEKTVQINKHIWFYQNVD